MQNDFETLISRINKLTPQSQALWGKMSVAQMLAHVNVGLSNSIGRAKQKRVFIGFLFGKMAKKSVLSENKFKRNLITGKDFKIVSQCDFTTEKDNLLVILDEINSKGKTIFTHEPHPFFGKLSHDEWNTLQYKHLDHHLEQFGC